MPLLIGLVCLLSQGWFEEPVHSCVRSLKSVHSHVSTFWEALVQTCRCANDVPMVGHWGPNDPQNYRIFPQSVESSPIHQDTNILACKLQ